MFNPEQIYKLFFFNIFYTKVINSGNLELLKHKKRKNKDIFTHRLTLDGAITPKEGLLM